MNKDNPYYAVIFTSTLNDDDPAYDAMAKAMYKLAQQQPGFCIWNLPDQSWVLL